MKDLIDQPTKQTEEISIRIVMQAGDDFIQPLSIEDLDGVQNLMDWFRSPKQGPVWTWQVPSVRKSHMLHRTHIMGIDIDGYIEPDNYSVRWYHKMVDKIRVWLMARRVYGKNIKIKRFENPRGLSNGIGRGDESHETQEGQAYYTDNQHGIQGDTESKGSYDG